MERVLWAFKLQSYYHDNAGHFAIAAIATAVAFVADAARRDWRSSTGARRLLTAPAQGSAPRRQSVPVWRVGKGRNYGEPWPGSQGEHELLGSVLFHYSLQKNVCKGCHAIPVEYPKHVAWLLVHHQPPN